MNNYICKSIDEIKLFSSHTNNFLKTHNYVAGTYKIIFFKISEKIINIVDELEIFPTVIEKIITEYASKEIQINISNFDYRYNPLESFCKMYIIIDEITYSYLFLISKKLNNILFTLAKNVTGLPSNVFYYIDDNNVIGYNFLELFSAYNK